MEYKKISFYCKKCGKSAGVSVELTGELDLLATTQMEVKCRTNRCIRVLRLKKYTEGMLIEQADKTGKIWI